jgi:hypothetical protein
VSQQSPATENTQDPIQDTTIVYVGFTYQREKSHAVPEPDRCLRHS